MSFCRDRNILTSNTLLSLILSRRCMIYCAKTGALGQTYKPKSASTTWQKTNGSRKYNLLANACILIYSPIHPNLNNQFAVSNPIPAVPIRYWSSIDRPTIPIPSFHFFFNIDYSIPITLIHCSITFFSKTNDAIKVHI